MNRDIVEQVLRDYDALRRPNADPELEAVHVAILLENVFEVALPEPRSALIAADDEIEEPAHHPGLALDCGRRQPAVSAQPQQVPVGVGGLGEPHRLPETANELKDSAAVVGDAMVGHTGGRTRQRELVDQFLFEVLDLIR